LALLKGLLAFEITARIPLGNRQLRRGIEVLLGVISVMALIGVVQRVVGLPAYKLTGRIDYALTFWQGAKAPSLYSHHNALGHACVLGGAMAIALALSDDGRRRRLYAGFAVVMLAGLIASASRESWLAAGLALFVIALITGSRRMWRLALVIAVVIIVGGVLVYASSPLLREEVARRGVGVLAGWHDYQLGFRGWEFRGEYRVYVVLKSWEIFQDHFWLGTGPGRFGGHIATLHLSPIYDQYHFLPLDGVYQPLDVFWSRLLTEFGVIGSAFFVWALIVAARAHRRASLSANSLTSAVGTGGLMAFVAVLVFGLFSPALEDPLVAIPFWGWAGVSWARFARGSEGAAQ
jgi:O-antigen ligase